MIDFESDGCTFIKWIDTKLHRHDYHKACVEHDYLYFLGGTEEDRLYADKLLKERWLEAGMHPWEAALYYRVVRSFGSNHWPTKLTPHNLQWHNDRKA